MLYVEHHWFLIIHCVFCIELHWKASRAFSSCRGRRRLMKSRNPGTDSQDSPFSSLNHILQDQSRNSHSLFKMFVNKIPSSVDQLALGKGSSKQLIRGQENYLPLKTAFRQFTWTRCLIRGSIWLTLVIVALELDYQSEKCQIMAMSIWCPMMTSSMMTVQKGQ